MLFVPKKYFNIIEYINMGHSTWNELVGGQVGGHVRHKTNILTYDDFDCMIYTYHDSNSEGDWNPFYYTVNRNQCTYENWKGNTLELFNKKDYNYRLL
tara:strand:- start:9 stop:302 length:294 start_codon:yes stop_codon:yes gene_type:complete